MHLFAQQPIPEVTLGMYVVLVLAALMTFCFVCAWLFLANRATVTKSILPRYEPRRPVPWTGLDVMAIVLFYLFIGFLIHILLFGLPAIGGQPAREGAQKIEQPADSPAEEVKKTTAHPAAQLFKNKDIKTLFLGFAVIVVTVPIFEEFFFRLIFTGWLLALERRWRKDLRRFHIPLAIIPINIPSLVFASLHFRNAAPEREESSLVLAMCILAVVSLLTMVFAIVWIGVRHNACPRDFGWDASKWREDLWTGVVAYFAVALPMYVVQIGLIYVLPEGIAPDPIVLYFFAVVLGTLYFRTNRLLPSIVLHTMLNAGSLTLAWLLM